MDAAAIEQMNNVRASLGLAPLPVPGGDGGGPQFKSKADNSDSEESDDLSTLEKRQAAAGNNWQKLEDERADKVDRQKRKDAAKKARDAAQRFTRLEGKGLGDAGDDGDEVDTRTWLRQQKKRQKQIDKSRKLQEELAARELQAEYTAKDLAGVKVGHEVDDFDETTGEQILTLKDAEIGEESEDDELENAELKAKERLEEKLRLKKRRPDYDPTEQGGQKDVLSKYDEEINGKKQKQFALDGFGTSNEATQKRATDEDRAKTKGVKISLDMFQDDTPISDYVDPSTIKVKRPKKKKERKTRQKAVDDDDDSILPPQPSSATPDVDGMNIDGVVTGRSGAEKKRALEFDDDDLQAKLAEQRRLALKKRKKLDAAEVARQLREEMPIDDEDGSENEGITIDETTEFVANLRKPENDEEKVRKPQGSNTVSMETAPEIKDEDDEGDVDMGETSYADVEDDEERKERLRRLESTPTEMTATGLEEEDVMTGHGLGASLAMLRKRGLITDPASDAMIEKDRQRTKFLAEKQNLIDEYDMKAREQREADRRSGHWDKMTNRDRDAYARQQNESRELYISRLLADKFNKEYKPDVKLQYTDEFGREMNQKEAFKHLSHMFHGKGSGKQKTEKRLKKIEDEKKNMAKGIMNIGEEGGMMNVQGREGKRQKMAGVRLQ